MKKLYLISQSENNDYDTYSEAVVCANDEEEARNTKVGTVGKFGSWVTPDKVKVEYIGKAKKDLGLGIVCSSFHAG